MFQQFFHLLFVYRFVEKSRHVFDNSPKILLHFLKTGIKDPRFVAEVIELMSMFHVLNNRLFVFNELIKNFLQCFSIIKSKSYPVVISGYIGIERVSENVYNFVLSLPKFGGKKGQWKVRFNEAGIFEIVHRLESSIQLPVYQVIKSEKMFWLAKEKLLFFLEKLTLKTESVALGLWTRPLQSCNHSSTTKEVPASKWFHTLEGLQ